MSPLILLLFTTEYCNIMMNSTCSVVYLSPLHTSFMQVFLASRNCYQFSWTGEKFFHQKRENFNSLSRLKKVRKLVFLLYQRTEYFLLEKKTSTFSENTLPENTFSENTFSENVLIIVIIMIVMVTMVIMVIKVVRVTSVMSMLTLSYTVTQ